MRSCSGFVIFRLQRGSIVLGDFEYKKARSLEEACRWLAASEGDGAVLAGGTDLLVDIRNGLRSPTLLVDCKGIDALRRFDTDKTRSIIGASVPLNRLIEHRDFRSAYPALADAAASIGTYQIRNRATLAGNICHASPAADSAPVLLVLNAVVEAVASSGERMIPVREFFAGVKRTVLKPDEIVTAIHLPSPSGLRTAFRKHQRIRGHDLAVVNVAGAYSVRERTLSVAVGSCAPTPILLGPLPVDTTDPAAFSARVVRDMCSCLTPISDVRASAAHRKAVLPVLVKRVLQDLMAEGGET